MRNKKTILENFFIQKLFCEWIKSISILKKNIFCKIKKHTFKKIKIWTPKKILKSCKFFIKEVDFYKKFSFVYLIIPSPVNLYVFTDNTFYVFEEYKLFKKITRKYLNKKQKDEKELSKN